MTIDEIWEAFIAADMNLTLKVPTADMVEYIKKTLSNYKHRLYAGEPELENLLGSFKFNYVADPVFDAEDKLKYWKLVITAQKQAKAQMDIEILDDGDD